MRNRKSRFLGFWCSLVPGAGEMYLGYFKTGISIMGLFCGIVAFASMMNIGALAFFLPIIWFYSFFHTHHLLSLIRTEAVLPEDRFFFHILEQLPRDRGSYGKYKKYAAAVLILIGLISLFNGMMELSYNLLPEQAYFALRSAASILPRLIFGMVIVSLGIFMIQGKKFELFQDDYQDDMREREERNREREELFNEIMRNQQGSKESAEMNGNVGGDVEREEELRREELRKEELRKEEMKREELRKEELRNEEMKREELRNDEMGKIG